MPVSARSSLLAACFVLGACTAQVRGGLSEREANQIVVALDNAAIAATKQGETGGAGRFSIEVGTADATRALRVLEQQKLPKIVDPGFEELYREGGLVATPHEERARWAAATAGELSRSLERLQGVLDARVHLALPETARPFDAEPSQPKAAVLVQRRRTSEPIDETLVRALVAGAVDGLRSDRVTVVQVVADPQPVTRRAFARFGPMTVSSDSVAALKALLGSSLALDLLMALALIAAARRMRGARR